MIRERSISRRRAVALLAVLACVLLASSVVVASVRMVTVSTISGRQSDEHFATVELLTAVRSACVQWIQRRSSAAVVAAPDLMWSGGIAVFEDTLESRGQTIRIRITAYDHSTRLPLGMLPELLSGSEDLHRHFGGFDPAGATEFKELENTLIESGISGRVFSGPDDRPALLDLFGMPTSRARSDPSSTQGIVPLNPRSVPESVVTILHGNDADAVIGALRMWRAAAARTGSAGRRTFSAPATPTDRRVRWSSDTTHWAMRIELSGDSSRYDFWAGYELFSGGWRLTSWHPIREALE